mmetsp:Transcript_7958/g.21946  ORF Transcript_7958/g.21946 Transcript_7958/m.21946 type:complete len:130 (-) Transcript_7958:175-564(-)
MWITTCCCAEKDAGLLEITNPALGEGPVSDWVSQPTCLTLTFEKPNGLSTQVNCTQRPLGMKYTKAVPLTVTGVHVHGHAHDLGIESGWKLRRIGESDLVGLSSDRVIGLLSEKANLLPFVESSPALEK